MLTCITCFMQAAIPGMIVEWPGRLPLGLTQLVLSHLQTYRKEPSALSDSNTGFLSEHLPQLRSLRHLALHGPRMSKYLLYQVCAIAGLLPRLVSLQLVRTLRAVVLHGTVASASEWQPTFTLWPTSMLPCTA